MSTYRFLVLADRIRRLPSWWIGVLVGVLFLCTAVGFAERGAFLDRQISLWEYEAAPADRIAACGEQTRDGRPVPVDRRSFDGRKGGYDLQQATCWLTAIGLEGRRNYAFTQGSLDVVFPFAYGLLLLILMARGMKEDVTWRVWLVWALLLPGLTVLFDLGEGLLTILLARSDPASLSGTLVQVASVLTVAKWVSLGVSFLAVVAFGRRVLGTLLAHLALSRVSAVGLGLVCLLPMLAIARQPTVENVFISEDGRQLGFSAFLAVLAVVLLGHTLVVTWQLAAERSRVRPLGLPLFAHAGFPGAKALSMTCGLAAVLLFPFLWVLATRAEEGVSSFGLFVGVVLALLLVAAAALGVKELRERDAKRPPGDLGLVDRWLCKLGPGYWDKETKQAQPGHKLSATLAVVLVLVYLAFFFLYAPDDSLQPPSALPFVLLFITLVCQILAGAAFFFDRWRVPVVLVIVLFTSVLNSFFPRSHEFITYAGHQTVPEQTPDPVLGKKGSTLTVIAADGGGIQAAAWSAQVLTSLQDELGDEFTNSVRLISSVSGGSVGVYFYLDAAAHDNKNGPAPASRDCVRRAAAASSLGATAWGLIGPDFQRLFSPFGRPTFDRGWAIERAWINTSARMRKAIPAADPGAMGCKGPFDAEEGVRSEPLESSRLSRWRDRALARKMPYLIFNSTFVDNGQQAFFTTADLESVGCSEDETCRDFAHFDLHAATAARLSATFPYVTPIARPSLDNLSPADAAKVGKWSAADGGYFDNFGSFAAMQWLDHHKQALVKQGIARVVFLQILTFPKTEAQPPDGSEGLLYSTIGPLQALLAVRTSSQLDRTEVERSFLERSFENGGPELIKATLRPPYRPNQAAPLSWHLSKENIQVIQNQWLDVCRGEGDMQTLRDVFGITTSTCGAS